MRPLLLPPQLPIRVAATLLLAAPAPALATVSLVKDVNAQINPLNSNPQDIVNVNGIAFFTADDGIHGRELWKSDGTAEGTVLVRDIAPYNASPNPTNLVSANGLVFFTANDGTHGIEVWKSDGTEGGTMMVKDIRPDTASPNPGQLVSSGELVFFTANDGIHGVELWKSDGTAEGTVLVKDIRPDTASSNPSHLASSGELVFFAANDGTHGIEVWKSDGAEAGTVMVMDINPGTGASSPRDFVDVDGTVFFSADDGTNGPELWKSDGTEPGTMMVEDITPGSAGSSPAQFTDLNGTLFFKVSNQLWTSDGTEEGTVMVANIAPGSTLFTEVNGRLYFTESGFGDALYRSDGTPEGSVLVYSDPFFCLRYGGHSRLIPFGFGGMDYFFAQCPQGGLFITDGTPAGSASVVRFAPTTIAPVEAGGVLFFPASDGIHGVELWRSDGTPDGTHMVKDINAGTMASSPANLADANGTLLFSANDGVAGVELWTSDGTVEGTSMVKNINEGGTGSSNPGQFTDLDGVTYFRAADSLAGIELWRTDGTSEGTVRVRDINPGTAHSSPSHLVAFDGALLFTAFDSVFGAELWRSDGTEAGTVRVKDIWPDNGSSSPAGLVPVNGELFFTADDGTSGVELWKSDGTEEGTVMVRDINDAGSSSPAELTEAGGILFFTANDGTHGVELWRSDGTPDGTAMVMDIFSGAPSGTSGLADLTELNGLVFFAANGGSSGKELWKSDGTEAGTMLVKDIVPSSGSSNPRDLFAWNGDLYFGASDALSGLELWRSDGTSDDTVRVKDINPTGSASPRELTASNGRMFFRANDGVHGEELWTTDGTEEGTFMVTDLMEGPVGSSPGNLAFSGGTLFFTADRHDTGSELFALFRDDFGDAPAPYPTLLTGDGARHLIPTGGATLFFGAAAPDGGLDARPDATATGDDLHEEADEDGVALPPYLNSGQTQTAAVTVTGEGGLLSAWIDWNADGDWDDASEQIFADEPVVEGLNELDLAVPVLSVSGPSFARLRLSTAAGLAPTGLAPDGEVEDYQVTLNLPPSLAGASAPNVGQEGAWQTSYSFTVTFSDDHGILVASIDPNDVTVTGPGGAVAIVSANEPSGADGSPRTVTYTVTPPGGQWNDADNGTYTIALASGQIADVGGLFVAAAPLVATFTVNMDTTPPETLIVDQPADPTNQTSALFVLSADDGAGTGVGAYEYSLDGGAFEPANNPQAITELADGAHTLAVRAIDLVGNVDASPATYTWTVDTIPPETELTGQPLDPTALTEAAFSFDGSDDGGTGVAGFEMSLDGAPFAAATSPEPLSGLGDGMHTFQVRAVDAAGNIDPTPASFTWIVDLTPPDTAITSQPRSVTARTTATFELTGDDALTAIAGFEVSLDDGPFVPATSPHSLSNLSDGMHTFRVRAIDAVGHADPTPASYMWTVNAIPSPDFAISEIGLLESDPGMLRIAWVSAGPAFVYTVEESDSMHGDWRPSPSAIPWPTTATEFEIPLVGPRQFFRIRADPID